MFWTMNMNDSVPITTSSQELSTRDRTFLQMKVVDDTPLSSRTTGRRSASTPLFVNQGNKLEVPPCDSKSVYSQSIATSDTSSVVSAESTISSVVDSEPGQKSALKQEDAPRRTRNRQQTRIQFNLVIQQQPHIPLHEYTAQELDTCWFRGEEKAQITRKCYKSINRLEQEQQQGHHNESFHRRKEHCFRGLESHTRQAAIAKTQNRRVAWNAVLDEQCDQVSLGVIDDDAIANTYHDASQSCMLWAIRVAQHDQRATELVYDVMLD